MSKLLSCPNGWIRSNTSTKDHFLEILFFDRKQVDHKTLWGLGGEFLSIHSSFVNTSPLLVTYTTLLYSDTYKNFFFFKNINLKFDAEYLYQFVETYFEIVQIMLYDFNLNYQ